MLKNLFVCIYMCMFFNIKGEYFRKRYIKETKQSNIYNKKIVYSFYL